MEKIPLSMVDCVLFESVSGNAGNLILEDSQGGVVTLDLVTLAKNYLTSLAQQSIGSMLSAASKVAINPITPKEGDLQVSAGPIISIYSAGGWHQMFPVILD